MTLTFVGLAFTCIGNACLAVSAAIMDPLEIKAAVAAWKVAGAGMGACAVGVALCLAGLWLR